MGVANELAFAEHSGRVTSAGLELCFLLELEVFVCEETCAPKIPVGHFRMGFSSIPGFINWVYSKAFEPPPSGCARAP